MYAERIQCVWSLSYVLDKMPGGKLKKFLIPMFHSDANPIHRISVGRQPLLCLNQVHSPSMHMFLGPQGKQSHNNNDRVHEMERAHARRAPLFFPMRGGGSARLLSAPGGFCRLLSASVVFCRLLSAPVDSSRLPSASLGSIGLLAVSVGFSRFLSAPVGFFRFLCRLLSASVGFCRLLSAHVAFCRLLSASVGFFRFPSASIGSSRLLSAPVVSFRLPSDVGVAPCCPQPHSPGSVSLSRVSLSKRSAPQHLFLIII